MVKKTWQERSQETAEYHKRRVREKHPEYHSIRDTADELRRSVGSITEDLILDSWMKTHPKVEEMPFAYQALEFIRDKKRELRLR